MCKIGINAGNSVHNDNKLAEQEIGLKESENDNHYVEYKMGFQVTPIKGSKDKELVDENLVVSSPSKIMQQIAGNNECPSLADFDEIHPPGGSQAVILYTTSMRGIRKTFQDCNTVRFLLRSFKIIYHERDVSMHLEYREELWKILGGKVIPPRLFIKGRYIGGADEVVGLHEMGWLGKLLEGTPIDFVDASCNGCACTRFVICYSCNGSCKVFTTYGDNKNECFIRCLECNENGLVKCPICY
ncbi:uncharacterized protein At5g39865 [Vigna unguiculata]|uniref:uncharacterized protein At5g39865 n=1 Tax=Vigna unguiculata TaxID=3917 RepID=UPI0010167EA5|nr:uncharacterized protein At5g39865 [Vigna unguiculata]